MPPDEHSDKTQPGAPQGQDRPSKAEQPAILAREFANFLIELSIALHKHAIYPEGHPSLVPAVERVAGDLAELLPKQGTLSLGVARKQLVIEGVATDTKNPVLADLADRLHNHQLGAVTFLQGVTPGEVHLVLKVVAQDPNLEGNKPLGLDQQNRIDIQPHIHLYPVNYNKLELLDDEGKPEDEEEQEARTRAAQLWLGLAQAAIATADDQEEGQETNTEPTAVAHAIADHHKDEAYDQVIVGYLLQIAEELKTAGGAEALRLQKRMSKLVSSLDPETIERLLEMGGESNQRRKFLLDASQGMTVDAVLDLVQAAGEAEKKPISQSLLRIFQKLSHHAEGGPPERREEVEQSVRDQIASMVHGWTLDDPSPDSYSEALGTMAQRPSGFNVAPEEQFRPESKRMIQMALEVDVAGPALYRAVSDLIATHELPWLMDIMEKANAPSATNAIWTELSSPKRFKTVLKTEPVDATVLDRLLEQVGYKGTEPMLEVLTESESAGTRQLLLDRLSQIGPTIGPLAVARLNDDRWYVQRNMLAIISRLPEIPEGFDPSAYIDHKDARVRWEAFEVMMAIPMHRERAICRALTDSDENIVRLGLSACKEKCPKAAVSLLVSRATSASTSAHRLAAIQALGTAETPAALETLLKMASPRKSFFGLKPQRKSAEYLASLEAIHNYPGDERAKKALDVAGKSKDGQISDAAKRHKAATKRSKGKASGD